MKPSNQTKIASTDAWRVSFVAHFSVIFGVIALSGCFDTGLGGAPGKDDTNQNDTNTVGVGNGTGTGINGTGVPPVGNGYFNKAIGAQALNNSDLVSRAPFMGWTKAQVQWGGGASGDGGASGFVADAHGKGLKVLLSVTASDKYPQSAVNADEFAAFVANVAMAGPDAIEVWNEPNIDREWYHADVSAGSYVNLLSKAYNAIKSANSSVMVISGALAPTGGAGDAGCKYDPNAEQPVGFCNDDRFLSDMLAAGAANYLDCVGAHYNAGTVDPDATTGGSSDHYSWYFGPMIQTYSVVGKPICFTELGYLTPAGFNESLNSDFNWASTTTLDNHAQWLARAVQKAEADSRVNMVIVFNFDFEGSLSADPMAGYAMVRPDDSCPACDTIGAVANPL